MQVITTQNYPKLSTFLVQWTVSCDMLGSKSP